LLIKLGIATKNLRAAKPRRAVEELGLGLSLRLLELAKGILGWGCETLILLPKCAEACLLRLWL